MSLTIDAESLLALGQGPETNKFITLASAVLSDGLRDDAVRLLLVRRLAEQGLFARACEEARACSETVRSSDQFEGMCRNLATARPDGRLAWGDFARQYDANLEALRDRWPEADRLAGLRDELCERLELHRTRAGQFEVYDRRSGQWRPAFGNHLPTPPAAELARQFSNRLLAPVLLDGVGLGLHLPWLWEATADTLLGATAVIYVVERSLEALHVALHLADWVPALRSERVRLCLGDDAWGQFERLTIEDECNYPPQLVVRPSPWGGTNLDVGPLFKRITEQYEQRRERIQVEVARQYAGRSVAWWARRYDEALSGGERLRVMGLTCRFSTVLKYSMRDLLAAFADAGCDTRLAVEPSDHERVTPRSLLRTVNEFSPDLVVIIDHTRKGQRAGLPDELPVLTWVQDRMPQLFSRETGLSLGPLDFCMGFARKELVERWAYPADRFLECEMATNPAALMPPGVSPDDVYSGRYAEDPGDYDCDVAFATTHSTAPEELHRQIVRGYGEGVRRVADAAFEELQARCARSELNGGMDFAHFLRELSGRLGIALSDEQLAVMSEEHARVVADQLLRHQMIDWAAEWARQTGHRLALYGRGWEHHPRFKQFARGFVEHGPDLGRAFRAAKINLHGGCNRAFHQRVLDGLTAGGFFLIRRHADDIGHPVWRAMYELLRAGQVGPGDELVASDLPESVRPLWMRLRRMRGLPAEMPVRLTPEFVQRLRAMFESDDYPTPAGLWPDLEQITFESREEFFERLTHYISNEQQRREIAARMRAGVERAFGYRHLVARLLPWLRDRLRQEAEQASARS